MNCEKARQLLDAYIDAEISAEDLRALTDHAQACEECRRELEAAQLLRDAFADMKEEPVPLTAQAAWRRAVAAEAKKKRARRWMRAAYAVAAALVLVIGATAILGNAGNDMAFPEPQNSMVMAGMIARDGSADQAAGAGEMLNADYTVLKKISSGDIEEAFASLEMLAAEYSGNCAMTGSDMCRIELPYVHLSDFLKASGRIGTELSVEIYDEEAETAVILIQFCAE